MSDLIHRWMQERREHAVRLLEEAEAAERQVAATCLHLGDDPEWASLLIDCRKRTEAAREVLKQFDQELAHSSGANR